MDHRAALGILVARRSQDVVGVIDPIPVERDALNPNIVQVRVAEDGRVRVAGENGAEPSLIVHQAKDRFATEEPHTAADPDAVPPAVLGVWVGDDGNIEGAGGEHDGPPALARGLVDRGLDGCIVGVSIVGRSIGVVVRTQNRRLAGPVAALVEAFGTRGDRSTARQRKHYDSAGSAGR